MPSRQVESFNISNRLIRRTTDTSILVVAIIDHIGEVLGFVVHESAYNL